MAVLAFAQLITVGTALTIRTEQVQPSSPRVLPIVNSPQQPLKLRSLADILDSVGEEPLRASENDHAPVRIPAQPSTHVAPLGGAPTSVVGSPALQLPPIADARVERLVQESRILHLDGDMMRAMLKLDEAERIDPSEPAVTYQKAMLFEDMGIFIKAADQYQKIQQMGKKAGTYFNLAANKLTQGMDTAVARRSVISIGPMQTRKTTGAAGITHADVAITILARPDKPINPADVHVQIHFYDKINGGEIKKATSSAVIDSSWTDTKLDWKDPGNEERLHVSYTILAANLADEHLLGRREFYGYVIELLYKGEVIDQQANPRRLHSVHGSKMGPIPGMGDPMPWLPGDDGSLLPPRKDSGYSQDPSRAPLPTR